MTRTILRVLTMVVVMTTGFALVPIAGVQPARAAPAVPKVMPLGDSLTEGDDVPGGYRIDLWQRLVASGHEIDFVGSQFNGPASLGDKNHEGHPGWVIEAITRDMGPWLSTYQPDIVLLLIGTNDMNGELNVETAPQRLSDLIDQIIAPDADRHVIVASLPPLAAPDKNEHVLYYNAAIPGIVKAKVAAGKKVSFVDMYSAVGVSDLTSDGIHPGSAGYAKMAAVWYDALVSFLPLGNAATTWYFAEGYTGSGFDEYLTIMNPSDADASVRITYYLRASQTVVKTLTARANARTTVAVYDAVLGVGRGQEVAAKVESTNSVGIIVERPIYFRYGSRITGGHNAMGANAPRQNWYFAEGYTGTGFDQYLTIMNPNDSPAEVTITYYLNTGATQVKTVTVGATSRYTVAVHGTAEGVGRGREVSARVSTTHPGGIVVERPMYFTYGAGWTGGHNVLGADGPRTSWYFAEGHTGTGFDEYLTIMNPDSSRASVTLTYYLASGGAPIVKDITVPPTSRYTVAVHGTAEGVGRGQNVSARVTSNVAIVVERPMYFTYGAGITGGHDVMGVERPRPTWYFAEGFTGNGFDQYLTILNPNDSLITVTLSYYLANGSVVSKAVAVPANSRYTVTVYDSALGVGRGWELSAQVMSPLPIVVERPIYFVYGAGLDGGHNVMGYAP